MKWNWQQKEWPNFTYDKKSLIKHEEDFLYHSGVLLGAFKYINDEDKKDLVVDLISNEAIKTSEIEGIHLDRESVQSSIKKHFGLGTNKQKIPDAEQGISNMLMYLYHNYQKNLSHNMIHEWHRMLMKGRKDISIGKYRTHKEPMQVVSGPVYKSKVHFEAPPSNKVQKEMSQFISWFNNTSAKNKIKLPILTRSGIAHYYFVSIHPFEDGNGRIARLLSMKVLFEHLNYPLLILLGNQIQNKKKDYYQALEKNNKKINITDWLMYFSETLLSAQKETQRFIDFLIQKIKFFDQYRDKLNTRQQKVLLRLFKEGPDGFKGGLSADNYISITKTSRATATRDLQDLLDKKALNKTGQLKSTRYFLNLN